MIRKIVMIIKMEENGGRIYDRFKKIAKRNISK